MTIANCSQGVLKNLMADRSIKPDGKKRGAANRPAEGKFLIVKEPVRLAVGGA